MDLLIQDPQKPKFSLSKKTIAILVVCTLLIALVVAFYVYTIVKYSTDTTPQAEQEYAAAPLEPGVFDGYVFVSVIPKATTTGESYGAVPLVADVNEATMYALEVNEIAGDPAMTLQYNVSPDLTKAVFLGKTLSSVESGTPVESWNVYKAEVSEPSTYDELLEKIENTSMAFAGSDEDFFRQLPVVNPNGAILYASLNKGTFTEASSTLETLPAETWGIYLITPDGTTKRISSGIQPKWINNSSFAFLKNDGVYVFDLTLNGEYQVWEMQNRNTVLNGLAVSSDGSRFAITNPTDGELTIVGVADWRTRLLSPAEVITTVATNPVFSPDGTYLAMVAKRPIEPNSEKTISQIEYYSLADHTFMNQAVPIDAETIAGIYLTGWY